jgi:AP-3 complex subunit delta-1
VLTHSYLVAQQEDVIMECIDSPDISIRLRALDLVVGMVSSENLMSIVGRLMRQLRSSHGAGGSKEMAPNSVYEIDPRAESDEESPEVEIKSQRRGDDHNLRLPDDYKVDVIGRILKMCSANNYGNLTDFDWYIDILIQLTRNAPQPTASPAPHLPTVTKDVGVFDISERIGDELRTVAVKVKAIRPSATKAAESIILDSYHGRISGATGALRPLAWISGEFAAYLSLPEDVLIALLHFSKSSSDPETLSLYLQSVPKIFSYLSGNEMVDWTPERKTMTSLLMARILNTLEALDLHPDLEVQERAVEFTELLRLAAEASAGLEPSSDVEHQDPPLLLTQAIPSLFSGLELQSVAASAQRNVPLPSALNLDEPISMHLTDLLKAVDPSPLEEGDGDDFEVYYHKPAANPAVVGQDSAAARLTPKSNEIISSYQHDTEDSYLDPDIIARRRAERLERNKDDPFYIAGDGNGSAASTHFDTIIRSDNGDDLDIDSIPIMQLDLGNTNSVTADKKPKNRLVPKMQLNIQITADETLATSGTSTPGNEDSETSHDGQTRTRAIRPKKGLLLVDSSNIGDFSLEASQDGGREIPIDYERAHKEEVEMAKAMQEVEKLRLEMQRANERIQAAQGIPPQGTVVKKKAKKKSKPAIDEGEDVQHQKVKKKKKKKTKTAEEVTEGSLPVATVLQKKKKKKAVDLSSVDNPSVDDRQSRQ